MIVFPEKIDERCFPMSQDANVLDLGCGIGFWTIELSKRVKHVTAADLTNQTIKLAKKKV